MILVKLWVLVLGLSWGLVCWGQSSTCVSGDDCFQRGQFELAVQKWEEARSKLDPEKSLADYVSLSMRLANGYQELGQLRNALMALQPLTDQNSLKPDDRADVFTELSTIYTGMRDFSKEQSSLVEGACSQKGKLVVEKERKPCTQEKSVPEVFMEEANKCLTEAEAYIVAAKSPWLLAKFHNAKGNWWMVQKEYGYAISEYQKVQTVNSTPQDKAVSLLKAESSINLIQAYVAFLSTYQEKVRSFEGVGKKALSFKDEQDKINHYLYFSANVGNTGLSLKAILKKFENIQRNPSKLVEQLTSLEGKNLSHKKAVDTLANILTILGNDELSQQIQDAIEKEYSNSLNILKSTIPDSHDKVFALLGLEKLMQSLPTSVKSVKVRLETLEAAKIVAQTIQDKNATAYINSSLAQLYADSGRYSEASTLISEAITNTQSYPQLVRQEGNNSVQITNADSFVSKRFRLYLHSLEDERNELSKICRKKCGPCSQGKFPKECEGCKELPPLFLQDYHPELLYQLHWQLGTFLKAQGKGKRLEAIKSYQDAVEYLQQVRHLYGSVSYSFREKAQKLYFDLADLLIQESLLKSAIDSIELSQETKLQNFFSDECVGARLKDKLEVTDKVVPDGTAVFYPIAFDDRLELLLVFADGSIKRFTPSEKVTANQLKESANTFWDKVQNEAYRKERFETGTEPLAKYFSDANQLYKWLIEPIHNELITRKISTLVIVPHNTMLTIPFAALCDDCSDNVKENIKNHKFLVQQDYALAITPAWELTDLRVLKHRTNTVALLNALSIKSSCGGENFEVLTHAKEEVENIFKVLTHAKEEVENIKDQLPIPKGTQTLINKEEVENIKDQLLIPKGTTQTLINEEFDFAGLTGNLKDVPYAIIHFATHGHFEENSSNIFLLAYDEKLTLNVLDSLFNTQLFDEHPVELLTLSACESALGQEQQATLGLAGTAIKTGVRGVVATLWKVKEDSTKLLVQKFYEQLSKPGTSKAKALQLAQLDLLKNTKYDNWDDPYSWAAFLVIGNWLPLFEKEESSH
ncbi:MAG: hypothetical protein BWK78_02105 [Thiotrichaceae bacterium IS1]|nr:MAG: hypothetical protein BWK78_02105 [Thiotrichaceae bacterium IS1]